MEQRIKKINNYRKTVWFSFGFQLLVFLGMIGLMRPKFETADDSMIRNLANGAKGMQEIHLVYQNSILGKIYQTLYGIWKEVPWYVLLQYGLLLIAFTAVSYVIFQCIEEQQGWLLLLILMIYFGYECYIHIHYVKTAGILAAASVFLLFYAERSKETSSWHSFAAGWFLGFAASLYCFAQFAVCAMLMTGIGLYQWITPKERTQGQKIQILIRWLRSFGLLFGIATAVFVGNKAAYQNTQWKEYQQRRQLSEELFSYGFPDYDQNEALYQELGIDKSTWSLYQNNGINDPEKLSLETMEKLAEAKPENKLTKSHFAVFLRTFPWEYLKTRTFACFLLTVLFWLFFGKKKKQEIITIIYEVVLFGLTYFYLFYQGRYLRNWVDTGFWFALSLVLIWLLQKKDGQPAAEKTAVSAGNASSLSGKTAVILCLMVLILNQKSWSGQWRVQSYNTEEKQRNGRLMEQIQQDKDHLYLILSSKTEGRKSEQPFRDWEKGALENVSWLNGWDFYFPTNQQILEKYDTVSPYRDLIDNDNVYLIAEEINPMLNYIQTYYSAEARAEAVEKYGEVTLYKIVTK